MKKQKLFTAIIGVLIIGLSACEIENPDGFDIRDDFTGSWICAEESQIFGNTNYTVTITKSPTDSTKIFIANFYQLGSSVRASAFVSGNQLSISSQNLDGNTVSGSGSLVSDEIDLSYTVNDGQATDNVTATYSQ